MNETETWKLVPADDAKRPLSDPAIPDEMVFAGIAAMDKAQDDLRRGGGPDWDTGMICVAVYRAMCAASPPAPAAEAVAWMCGPALFFTTDKRQATAHERHGTTVTPLYTHPLDAATVRAEARREALEGAVAAAINREKEWMRKAVEPGRSDHDVAVFESAASAAAEIRADIAVLADKGEAE